MSAPAVACPAIYPHEPHFYVSVIVGGAPGPVPSLGCVCPGREEWVL